METSLHYAQDTKQLGFRLREVITTKYAIELKGKGLFNSVTGGLEYRGTVKKNIAAGEAKEEGATPLTIGAPARC